jgi:hypothetical protein
MPSGEGLRSRCLLGQLSQTQLKRTITAQTAIYRTIMGRFYDIASHFRQKMVSSLAFSPSTVGARVKTRQNKGHLICYRASNGPAPYS